MESHRAHEHQATLCLPGEVAPNGTRPRHLQCSYYLPISTAWCRGDAVLVILLLGDVVSTDPQQFKPY